MIGNGEVHEIDLGDQRRTDNEGATPPRVDGETGDALLYPVVNDGHPPRHADAPEQAEQPEVRQTVREVVIEAGELGTAEEAGPQNT